MTRCLLVAELATAHHGDVGLAKAMIAQAAEAGADYVKIQSYSLDALNPADPQAQWLRESWLDEDAHVHLQLVAEHHKVTLMSTPFDRAALDMLRKCKIDVKIASSASGASWWSFADVVSYPWGRKGDRDAFYALTAIPLYPTPLECVGQVPLLDGWSDHCIGIDACLYAIARGAKMIEVHFTIEGARHMAFDKTAKDIVLLRSFAESVATMTTGVSRVFRDRWTA